MIQTIIIEKNVFPSLASVECIINPGMRHITFSHNLSIYRQFIPYIIRALSVLGVKTQLKKIHFAIKTDVPKLENENYLPALILCAYQKALKLPETPVIVFGSINCDTGEYTASQSLTRLIPLTRQKDILILPNGIISLVISQTFLPISFSVTKRYESRKELHVMYSKESPFLQDESFKLSDSLLFWIEHYTNIELNSVVHEKRVIAESQYVPYLQNLPRMVLDQIPMTIILSKKTTGPELKLIQRLLDSTPRFRIAINLQQTQAYIDARILHQLLIFTKENTWDSLVLHDNKETKQISLNELERILTL